MPRVLLVDDDEDVRMVLARALKLFEFEVVCFADAAPALQGVDFDAIDIVITDLQMPTSGDRLIREIRKKGYGVPIIVLSGMLNGVDVKRLRVEGADAFLSKPVAFSELNSAIQELLSGT